MPMNPRLHERRVVVTGLGVVASIGHNVDAFWSGIISGKVGVDRVTLFDPTNFACQIGAEVRNWDVNTLMDPKEARRNDRYTHFGFVAARQAVADSGLDMAKEDGDRVGVVIGSGIGGMYTYENQCRVLFERGPRKVSPFAIPSLIGNMCAGLVAIELGARGPNFGMVSACATGTHALGEAAHAIRRGDSDVMIAGGSEAAITPFAYATFCAMKAMSTRNDNPRGASRPFDKNRDGFIMGEGAGILVIESLEHARARGARIYAEMTGYGNTADASHITAPSPGGEGAARCMRMALRSAGLNPGDISYINAHGTSTPQGDVAETKAIKTVFGEAARKIAVSSTKGATGHMLGAAGAAEMVLCVKAIQTGLVPPTINLENADPECDLDYVPGAAREMRVNAVVNNSFGFGGHNASVVAVRFEG